MGQQNILGKCGSKIGTKSGREIFFFWKTIPNFFVDAPTKNSQIFCCDFYAFRSYMRVGISNMLLGSFNEVNKLHSFESVIFIRSNLSSITGMVDERSLKFTDSYLTSTISTTSGLGSNYTTNTSGSSITHQTTPSPRRKTSSTSFIEVADIPENELEENITQYFTPLSPNAINHRTQNQPQTSHYFNRMQNYGVTTGQRSNGYFSEYFTKYYFQDQILISYFSRFKLLSISTGYQHGPRTGL